MYWIQHQINFCSYKHHLVLENNMHRGIVTPEVWIALSSKFVLLGFIHSLAQNSTWILFWRAACLSVLVGMIDAQKMTRGWRKHVCVSDRDAKTTSTTKILSSPSQSHHNHSHSHSRPQQNRHRSNLHPTLHLAHYYQILPLRPTWKEDTQYFTLVDNYHEILIICHGGCGCSRCLARRTIFHTILDVSSPTIIILFQANDSNSREK